MKNVPEACRHNLSITEDLKFVKGKIEKMKRIYCSINVTGAAEDLPRAEAVRSAVLSEGNIPIIPLLLFREILGINGEERTQCLEFSVHMMEQCDEVRLYDPPEKSVTCANDRTFALNLSIPVVDMAQNRNMFDRDLGTVLRFYQEMIGTFPPRICFSEISDWLSKGLTAGLVMEAIKIGVQKGKSWSYISGILRNFHVAHIFTLGQLDEYKKGSNHKGGKNEPSYDLSEFHRRLTEGIL